MVTAAIWLALDYSRVPYRLYHDAEIYACEQERIFSGPVWSYLGLDSEIPEPGDFRATYVGETPVIFNRDKSGAVKAFVNRCAHRGALVRRELSGTARDNTDAGLLPEFLGTFGVDRSKQTGGVKMDARHRHNITWAEADSDTDEFAHAAYAGAGVRNDFLSLKEPSLVTFRPERDDKLNLVVTSVFPSAV